MPEDVPHLVFDETDDELGRALDALRKALARHPIAAQAAFAALAAEGRRFALTPEGASLRARLAKSETFHRARLVWDTVSVTAFAEEPVDPLPSAYVESVLQATQLDALEPFLSRLFDAKG